MTELILHHYEASPYSEKIRLLMGYKGLTWGSVIVPPVAPKPELIALTGGYRRVPVLQIGADVFCGSDLIAAELDRRFPNAPLSGTETGMVGDWVDRVLFWQVVRYGMGLRADAIPPALIADRAAFWRHSIDLPALKADAGYERMMICQGMDWLEDLLAGRDYFGGARPGLIDFALYHPLWFFIPVDHAAGGEGITGRPTLVAWHERMGSFGHGTRHEIAPQEALDIAAQSRSAPEADGPFARVIIEEFGSEEITGSLAHQDNERIILMRAGPNGTRIATHFPKRGSKLRLGNIETL